MFDELLRCPGVIEQCELRSLLRVPRLPRREPGAGDGRSGRGERRSAAGASLYAVRQPEELRWHIPSTLVDPSLAAGAGRVPRPRRASSSLSTAMAAGAIRTSSSSEGGTGSSRRGPRRVACRGAVAPLRRRSARDPTHAAGCAPGQSREPDRAAVASRSSCRRPFATARAPRRSRRAHLRRSALGSPTRGLSRAVGRLAVIGGHGILGTAFAAGRRARRRRHACTARRRCSTPAVTS